MTHSIKYLSLTEKKNSCDKWDLDRSAFWFPLIVFN